MRLNFSLKDTFDFIICLSTVYIKTMLILSFDVQSLFTNLPIEEVIDIVTEHGFSFNEQLAILPFEVSQLLGSQFLLVSLHRKLLDNRECNY